MRCPKTGTLLNIYNDSVAQLVEQQTLNLWVLSSSLSGVTGKAFQNYLKGLYCVDRILYNQCMKYINIIFLSYLLACCSCKESSSNKLNPECININNEGTEYIVSYQMGDTSALDKAVYYYEKAVQCDSTYLLGYRNLALAYDYKRAYKKELQVFNKMASLVNNASATLIDKAIVFEKLGLTDSAKYNYQLAQVMLKMGLTKQPRNVNLIRDYLLILALTKGGKAAINELDARVLLNPKISSELASERYIYQNFDKQQYIYDLTETVIMEN